MKPFLLFSFILLAVSAAMGQDNEYYRPNAQKEEPATKQQSGEIQRGEARKDSIAKLKQLADFKDQPFIDRLRAGGSFGLSFGSIINVNLSPMVGYELTEKLVGGVGATLMYFRYRYYDINTIYYGGRGFLMYNAFPMVNLIGEIELLNVEASYQKRQWIASPLIGASYSQPIGGRFIKGAHLTVLYNLNYNNQIDKYSRQSLSPYGSPFVFRLTFL